MTTTYTGTEAMGGKTVPASAQFSVENGRVAAIMKGSHTGRLIFDQKAQVLHIVSDDDKTYFDLDKSSAGRGGDQMQMMQAQLAKLPPEQRAMAEQMMKGVMSAAPPPLTYTQGTGTKTIAGYQCTMFEGMRGADKVTEYCGTTSSDFKMSDAERRTMLEMQGYLRNFTIMVKSSDDSMRAFQWDTTVDGYPVLTRCFRGGAMTLDLTLDGVNHKPIPNEVFEIPRGYKKQDLGKMGG
ncbi:MAG TPA: DUF4412 domain-containing protein [Vicinamibacterales bacterium]|nr:DUF4412 domain-containing protein [Vicinamibacterales bacterium]